MSNHSPIPSPPPELAEEWRMDYIGRAHAFIDVVTKAAQWGADRELEACCEWFICDWTDIETADKLRAARRPKPPSLKEQALLAIDTAVGDERLSADVARVVRRALEQLPDAL